VADLLRHGHFGLGTFDGLDGEGILLEGRCWQARADGRVVAVPPQTLSPFWVVLASGSIGAAQQRSCAAGAGGSALISEDRFHLLQGTAQVVGDFGGDQVGLGKVVGIEQAVVLEPEQIEADLGAAVGWS